MQGRRPLSWVRRVSLDECADWRPDLGCNFRRKAVIGIRGASYLAALHNLVTGKSSTATQVIAVVIFVIIDFALIIIPFGFLEQARGHQGAAQAHPGLAAELRPAAHDRHRSAPGRLPGHQRPDPAELTGMDIGRDNGGVVGRGYANRAPFAFTAQSRRSSSTSSRT